MVHSLGAVVVQATQSFIESIPKVELHQHLETSLRLRRLIERRQDGLVPMEGAHLVADPSLFSGYDRLRRLRYAGRSSRIADAAYTRANIAAIAAELVAEAANQSVRHVEMRVGGRRGFELLGVRGMLEAMAEGASSCEGLGVSYGVIITVVRERGPELADWLVGEALQCPDCRLVGIDLAGDEENYPPALFSRALGRARDAGMGITVHAGEFAGAAGIWAAIYHLGAMRIGHGIRAVEDPSLLDCFRERGVTVEICPSSNLRLGLIPSLEAHPLNAFLEHGVRVTVNSDDPMLLGTTLSRELHLMARAHGLGPDAVLDLMANAARAAFLPHDARSALERQVRSASVSS